MKLIIVRHAEPDYSIDSLTEKGWKEAEALSERLKKLPVKEYFLSPLGRAQDTAKATLEKTGRTGITLEWLREFSPAVMRPDCTDEPRCAWDWLPEDLEKRDHFFSKDDWGNEELYRSAKVKEEYNWVCREFDTLLEKHGYKRNGKFYDAVQPNDDTLMFFCHFGLECVLLSHLMNVSPIVLWHGFCAAPSSVTIINTEERRKGKAMFRAATLGDVSHLYAVGEPPSFAARFCELYTNEDERHD